MNFSPEIYYFKPTIFVPNNILPVLVYRDVLPTPHSEDTTKIILDGNLWEKGGTWGPVPRHHFHPNTHECYAVFRGQSTLLVGRGPLDKLEDGGQEIHMKAGDVIILPAGTSHCSISADPDYRYVGAYPMGSLKWKNEYCRDKDRLEELQNEISRVPLPQSDPVGGIKGPLMQLWSKVALRRSCMGSSLEASAHSGGGIGV